ncbi:hypothetical protein HPP92_019477 [Vanilla planifolia]|uniref:Uncharacterized protein n=1 Tax=Vanilla planifolia TaxID=51239 RepID=A0A835Q2D5_VANPL|nr:hypothetical protein HPP92_019477 [Vanilla planifolia]
MDSEATVRKDENVPENSFPAGISADNSFPCTNDHTANERLAPVKKSEKWNHLVFCLAQGGHAKFDPCGFQVVELSISLLSLLFVYLLNKLVLFIYNMTVNGWARATNRLIEKIEDDLEIMDELTPITRSNRRLVLTTQLIQQLIPPVPAKFLFTNAVASYEKIIYYITKLTLGKFADLVSTLQVNIALQLERKSRLDGCSSIIDARIECQDVERGLIINRFAKFHGRIPTDAIEGPSTSESAPRRSLLQRNVNVVPMPRYIPDVNCLSL